MFDKTACKSPVIVLKDIKCEDLEALLDYMYLGEVNVRQSELASLIKAAENLRIKGLAVPDDEPPNKVSGPSKSHDTRRDGGSGSPPAKRKRRDEGEDGREDVRPPPSQPSASSGLHTPPPLPSRPKSPSVSQRLSPSPHRTSQESPATDDRTSRPLSSPADTPTPASHAAPSQTQSSASQPVGQYRSDETPSYVKVEVEEDPPDNMTGDPYDVSTDGFKEEGDNGGMNSNLPEFLQSATAGAVGSSSYPSPSFAGPSGYQPVSDVTAPV